MTPTHGHHDYACFDCGDTVSYHIDPGGTWREKAPVERALFLRDAARLKNKPG